MAIHQADVRRIALALPGAAESTDHFAFSIMHDGKAKGIAWVWEARTTSTAARVPSPIVGVAGGGREGGSVGPHLTVGRVRGARDARR